MVEEKQIAKYGDSVSVYLSVSNVGRQSVNEREKPGTNVSRQTPQNVRYWVDAPRDHYVFTNEELVPADRTRRRALAWAAIISKTDCRDDEADRGYVPVAVSTHGKPYIAAYLFAIHDKPIEEIAHDMGLTNSTISQYVSDVVNSRR